MFAGPAKKIVESHAGKVKLVLRYVPFHEGADTIAKTLEAAKAQGKFWEALELVYERQREWADHEDPRPEIMWDHYPSAGLDVAKLREDMSSQEIAAALRQDMSDAAALGVRRTPTFYVNGQPLQKFDARELETLVATTVNEVYGP